MFLSPRRCVFWFSLWLSERLPVDVSRPRRRRPHNPLNVNREYVLKNCSSKLQENTHGRTWVDQVLRKHPETIKTPQDNIILHNSIQISTSVTCTQPISGFDFRCVCLLCKHGRRVSSPSVTTKRRVTPPSAPVAVVTSTWQALPCRGRGWGSFWKLPPAQRWMEQPSEGVSTQVTR